MISATGFARSQRTERAGNGIGETTRAFCPAHRRGQGEFNSCEGVAGFRLLLFIGSVYLTQTSRHAGIADRWDNTKTGSFRLTTLVVCGLRFQFALTTYSRI